MFPFRSIGSYRGDKNKLFPTNCVRFLTHDELLYIKEVVGFECAAANDSITCVLQHTDNNLDEHDKKTRDVYIIDFTRQSLSISKSSVTGSWKAQHV